MEDAAIVALYWKRDEDAIAETDRKYGKYCRAIAWNILTDREDTEECVSDTWIRAWETMPPQRPGSLSAFLGRIVRNLPISRWRREHAQKRYAGLESLLSALEECLSAPGGVEETVEQHRLSELISSWLDGLDREDRVLFLRRYWYGEAIDALAREWGHTPNRMAKRMLRLRKGLRAVLEREGVSL